MKENSPENPHNQEPGMAVEEYDYSEMADEVTVALERLRKDEPGVDPRLAIREVLKARNIPHIERDAHEETLNTIMFNRLKSKWLDRGRKDWMQTQRDLGRDNY